MLGVFLLLFLLCGASLLVIIDPAGTATLAGMKLPGSATNTQAAAKSPVRPSPREAAKVSAPAPTGSPVAAVAAVAEPARRPPPRTGTTTPAKPAGGMPPKAEGSNEKPATLDDSFKISRKARYVGPLKERVGVKAPPPELYPMTVSSRTFPDANSMTVVLAVQNLSGIQWKTAYVSFRSPKHNMPYQFVIEDWQLDEVIGFEYTFPKNDVEERLTDLRIAGINGDQRESALAEIISQSRRKVVEANAADRGVDSRRRTGDSLSAPGLLGAVGELQEPMTGINVTSSFREAREEKPIEITIPAEALVPAVIPATIRETSQERKEAADMAIAFHTTGLKVQNSIAAFTASLKETIYAEAMKGQAAKDLEVVRGALKEFNSKGIALATTIQKTPDSEIKRLSGTQKLLSGRVMTQVELVENEIRRQDSNFKLIP